MPPASSNSVSAPAGSQWLFSEEELSRTPSILDGMPAEQERENRSKGANFITQVGIMLKLPQLTLATASVFLHRFYMRYSMVEKEGRPAFHYYVCNPPCPAYTHAMEIAIAATALFLATKVEENCRKMKELVIACCRVAQKDANLIIDEQAKEFWRWKDTILHNEEILLEAMCFDLSLEPPYNMLFRFLVQFHEQNNKKLRNSAWAFLNDSHLTMLCLLFPSRTIAAAALYCAAKHCEVAFPDHGDRAWWEVVKVELKDIKKACNYMATVYELSPLRHSENIYARTPEDADPLFNKTRARQSPTAEPDLPTPHLIHSNSLEGSSMSISGSDEGRRDRNAQKSTKRTREGSVQSDKSHLGHPSSNDTLAQSHEVTGRNDDIPWGGQTPDEPERKRQRTAELSNTQEAAPERKPENGLERVKDEDLSEEGEVVEP
ncbi:hypothetical protein GP486_006145 [Trichoglossum hirsutum]|uniref:RNA polymerase II holoenzyme cyclin-like subunit n=1 Tax=Trichoglossum hirsutum TaxID=265104 RepID=A0A9P8RL00_9PEZI|nr:hypothetical protein GP486_006145 [Trichoglossum hirsutum]